MPWHIKEVPGLKPKKYFVETISTGRKHSKEPLSLMMAKKQLASLQINVDNKKK